MKKLHTLYQRKSGFTLIEMVLGIAILGILATSGFMAYSSYKANSDIDITSTAFVQLMRRAQILSKFGNNDSPWGIRVETDNVTLFRGEDYATRNTEYDETFEIPPTVEVIKTPTITGTCEHDTVVIVTITNSGEKMQTQCDNGVFRVNPIQDYSNIQISATGLQRDRAGNTSPISSISW